MDTAEQAPTLASFFGTTLRQQNLSARQLAELTNIPEDTIKGWLSGRGRSIREWERAIVVAAALDLPHQSTLTFFEVANVSVKRLEHAQHFPLSAPYREAQALVDQWLQRHQTQPISSSEPISIPNSLPIIPPQPNLIQRANKKTVAPRRFQWRLVWLIGLILAGVVLFRWLQLPQSSIAADEPAWTHGEWGTTDDRDYGGSARSHSVPFVCTPLDQSVENPPIADCMGIEGSIQDREGYVGIYRTLAQGELGTVDLSGYAAISFYVRGNGAMAHFGLEETHGPTESTEEHSANFTLTPEWQYVRIPLDSLIPIQPGTILDDTHVHAISWSIINGPQPDVWMMVDRVRLER